MKIKRICKICEKEFFIKPYQIETAKYCSRKCQGIGNSKNKRGENNPHWKGGLVKHICQQCGKEFYIEPSQIKQGKGKFCSKKCLYKWISLNKSGKNNYRWKGGKIERICQICKKKFYVDKAVIKRGRGKFCSRKCLGVWIVLHMKKKNTSIERLLEDELIHRDIPYTKQVPLLGITIVDFLLPKDIVIYCDGNYWHNLPGRKTKDVNQNFILTFYGYKVFRFTETEIKKSAKKCIDKIENKKLSEELNDK